MMRDDTASTINWNPSDIGTDLVLETNKMRVWHLRLAPGQTLPPHRHDRPYFWTVLTDGKGLSCFEDGRQVPVTYAAGATRHFPDLTPANGFVHDLTNVGDTELVFVTTEFKH
ncbi:cupin domain-containing protein [Ascidiaceihabitans sp.]|uniref:cupin domain-containing protein n=1 Tax=Ascidiaceihabitans sp. TaxID=1872644 RepID=UPI0032971D87